ncbi:MAG: TonB-dependent receptor [Ignavibacteriae bacterium]|nr:TonB-dependent receptor [Ignavibacteriota bacterium]
MIFKKLRISDSHLKLDVIKIGSFLILFLVSSYRAQTDSLYSTDEVVISASRYEEEISQVSKAVSIIPQNLIKIRNPLNVANLLTGNVGVWMQQTNHGGGSPFLRGLTGNQTLIMIDGIRLNNSTFRYGPNQYLNTMSMSEIERVEILRGSGSVQYGSDALGGVVHLLTKSPKIGLVNDFHTGIELKYLSSQMEQSANSYINYSTPNSGHRVSASFKKYGDIVAGNNLGKESPSSYDEYSFNFKNLHMISEKIFLTYNYQFLRQNDIDRFDQVSQRGYEYYKFDPQIRHLAYLKSEMFSSNKLAEKISLTFSWQQSSEERKTKKNDIDIKTIEKDVVDTWGASLLVYSKLRNNWILNSGIEYYYDYVKSKATIIPLFDDSKLEKRGLYSDGSKSHNISLFSLSNIYLNDYEIGFGARYNYAALVIHDSEFGQPIINPDAITGYALLAYNISDNLKVISKINTAYRIPNINDVSSFGLFDYGIEVPNNDLLPERSINYEVGMKFNNSNVHASIFLFRSDLTNLITRVKTTYKGDEFYNGENVYKKINIGESFIQGIEFGIKYSPSEVLIFINNLTYTYGENISKNEPMRRIPPLNGSLSMLYNYNKNIEFRIEYLYAFQQDRLSSGDIDDHRINENGTPAWNLFNIYSNYKLGNITIGLGLNNLFNEAYRMHGSGIDGIGRSFQIVGKFVY